MEIRVYLIILRDTVVKKGIFKEEDKVAKRAQ